MIRLTRSQVQPIGLDIGADSIRMLQLQVVDGALSVLAAARRTRSGATEVEGTPTLQLGDILRQMVRQNGFRGRRVVAALPREILHLKNLRLPCMPASELANAVAFEAESIFPFDVAESTLHYIPAGEVRQNNEIKQEVIVLAARNDDVEAFLEQLHYAGLIVESLDTEPTALYRTVDRFVRRREDEQTVSVLVDIGYRRSQVIIGRGREINLIKPIDIGGRHLHEAVSTKLGITSDEARALRRRFESQNTEEPMDPVRQAVYDATRVVAEELSREIALCLRYYTVTFRGHRPSNVRIVGGEACDASLIQQLAAGLPIPVEAWRPLANVDTRRMKATDRRGGMCDWATAFGLALKFCQGGLASQPPATATDRGTPRAPVAEVVDLNHAVQAQTPVMAGEVAHA